MRSCLFQEVESNFFGDIFGLVVCHDIPISSPCDLSYFCTPIYVKYKLVPSQPVLGLTSSRCFEAIKCCLGVQGKPSLGELHILVLKTFSINILIKWCVSISWKFFQRILIKQVNQHFSSYCKRLNHYLITFTIWTAPTHDWWKK